MDIADGGLYSVSPSHVHALQEPETRDLESAGAYMVFNRWTTWLLWVKIGWSQGPTG